MLNNFLKSKKNNWLITLGLAMLALGVLTLIYSYFFSPASESSYLISKYTSVPYFVFLLVAIIGAPIIEELSFRGGFSKSKIIKTLSIIGLISLLIITKNTITKIFTLIYLCVLIISFYKRNKLLEINLFLLNALIFSFFHLNVEELFTALSLAGFSFRFSFALFAIWICLNFNLFKSILFHAVWNTILMASISVMIFFPDKTINHYEDNNIKVTWYRQSKSLKGSTVNFFTPKNTIEAKNCNAIFLLKSTEWSTKNNDSTSKNFIPVELFMDYNFTIKLKDTTTKKQNLYKPVKRFLITNNLIKSIENND
ncbi:hypothetical protein [Mangrovimonas cancribranchiae]|uniref:CPBP family intramembrane metalloprotease n=1 Tax=Mangrovimonas cancribranchiae TaxID=3080055 RepID=A0AAU6NVH5_9FLAO